MCAFIPPTAHRNYLAKKTSENRFSFFPMKINILLKNDYWAHEMPNFLINTTFTSQSVKNSRQNPQYDSVLAIFRAGQKRSSEG